MSENLQPQNLNVEINKDPNLTVHAGEKLEIAQTDEQLLQELKDRLDRENGTIPENTLNVKTDEEMLQELRDSLGLTNKKNNLPPENKIPENDTDLKLADEVKVKIPPVIVPPVIERPIEPKKTEAAEELKFADEIEVRIPPIVAPPVINRMTPPEQVKVPPIILKHENQPEQIMTVEEKKWLDEIIEALDIKPKDLILHGNEDDKGRIMAGPVLDIYTKKKHLDSFEKDWGQLPENKKRLLDDLRKKLDSSVKQRKADQKDLDAAFDAMMESMQKSIRRSDFAYLDTDLPDDVKAANIEYTNKSESANKYVTALLELEKKYKDSERNPISDLVYAMLDEASKTMDRYEIIPSPYAQSKTWALWDISKQYYYFTHPKEVDPKYKIANPMESKGKQQEIVDRHVGWEVYGAYHGDQQGSILERLKTNRRFREIKAYLDKAPKANGTLSSYDLAALGSLLRK